MLSRHAAPALAPTAAAAQGQTPPRLTNPPSPPTPARPPGFPFPVFAGRELALMLFPQLADVQDPDAAVRPGSFSARDSAEERASLPRRSISAPSRPVAELRSEDLKRKVRFGPLQLAPVQSVPGIQAAPRPCLKTAAGSSAFSAPAMEETVACGAHHASPCVVSARLEMQRGARSPPPALTGPGRHPRSPKDRSIEGYSSEDWQPVRPRYWWRALRPSPERSRARQSPQYTRNALRRPYVKPSKRKCHNCLERGHPAAECRDPVRCSSCRGWRHIARECPSRCRKADVQLSDCIKTAVRHRDDHDMSRRDGDRSRRREDEDDMRGRRDERRFFRSRSRAADMRGDERRDERRDDRNRSDLHGKGLRRRSPSSDRLRRSRSSSRDGGRGRSPPRSCLGAQATPTIESMEMLPPPPPLPLGGPMPRRLFTPPQVTLLRRSPAARDASPTPTRLLTNSSCSPTTCTPPARVEAAEPALQARTSPVTPEDQTHVQVSVPPPAAQDTPLHVPTIAPLPGTPLFVPVQAPLLQAPSSTPPRKPTARRKTLAGVSSFAGFQLQRSSPRIRAKKRSMPIAKLAERVLCHRLGIVSEGEEVTEAAIAKFIQMFEGRLPDIAIAALRALFRMDCDFATAVEEALIEHGGAAAVDQQGELMAEPTGS